MQTEDFSFEPVPPMVMWAQRPNLIILTICVEDCKDPEIKVESDKLIFKGVGGPEKKQHELTINFFKDIDTEKTKYAVRDRVIEFALEKKDGEGPYWKRLVKEEKKQHWLKVDFNKWRYEDESDDEAGGGQDLEQMMSQMGGLGGAGGMPGMGGMGGMPGMGGGGKMERPSLDDL